jgi:hypothetical protein
VYLSYTCKEDKCTAFRLNSELLVGGVVLVVAAHAVAYVLHYSPFLLVVEVVEEQYGLHSQKSWSYSGWS